MTWPTDPSVVLLAGLASDGSPSMERYARELFSALLSLPANTRSITLEQPPEQPCLARVLDHPQTRRLDSAWNRYVAYPRSLRKRQAGLFHILDHGYSQLVRSLDPDRTVVTCHDVIPLLAAEGVIPMHVAPTVVRTFRWRMKQMVRARAIIASSIATKMMLERYTSVRPEQVTVVPLGVTSTFGLVPDDQGRARASGGVPASAAVILQVATGGRYKNTAVLLEGFARLRSAVRDVVLVRVGVPFHPDEAALAVRLGVQTAVRYLGALDDHALAAWYRSADVFVFPSLWEGFGLPPLEAMACGTPIVASDVPPIAEVVGDAGILVAADDPSGLARAIERVLTDEALAGALRQKGLARARQFTWSRTAIGTAAVYDQVLQ